MFRLSKEGGRLKKGFRGFLDVCEGLGSERSGNRSEGVCRIDAACPEIPEKSVIRLFFPTAW